MSLEVKVAGKKRCVIEAICRDKRGRKISSAFNNYNKTHPLQAHFCKLAGELERKGLHAELLALIRAGTTKVHSIEIINHGSRNMKCPCPACTEAIKSFGVETVIISTSADPATKAIIDLNNGERLK